MNRRDFLIGCSSTVAVSALSSFETFTFSEQDNKDIFVLVFLRGGCDALNMVAPISDKNYIDARSQNLRITETGENKGWLLKNTLNQLDFALHKSAKPLFDLYQNQNLAIIHACGLPNGTRSHFDAQDLIEKGITKKQNISDGWLARYLNQKQLDGAIPALASSNIPLSLLGSSQAISMSKPQDFNLKGDPRLKGLLKSLYNGDTLLDKTVQNTLKNIKTIQQKQPKEYIPSVDYPNAWYAQSFSNSLKTIAQTIKMDVGLQVATVDFGGWDTHENQSWTFDLLTKALSEGLMAFYNDLSGYHNRLSVLVMSEFGRRVKSNYSNGTDHGFGGVMFALGKNVKGGKMYGKWNGLATEQLDNGVDLAVTTDYRTILGEILTQRLNVPASDLKKIFPDFNLSNKLGFIN